MLGLNALTLFLTFPILALSARSRPKSESFELFGYNKDFGGAALFYSGGTSQTNAKHNFTDLIDLRLCICRSFK
jgi:hypothetical protein